MRNHSRRPMHREEGQALVLGALSLLILALMLMVSFNLTRTIHEKIRLQQQADAVAYSTAVVEARAFNYIAYANRAIASTYAAMITLHAHMAAATATVSMLMAGKKNFFAMIFIEIALCCTCSPPFVCCKIQHCIHAAKDARISRKFKREAKKQAQTVRRLDRLFQLAVRAFDWMAEAIHASQTAMLAYVVKTIQAGSGGALRPVFDNVPGTTYDTAVSLMSINKLGCALEGTLLPCIGGGSQVPKENQAMVLSNVTNAARPKWTAKRSASAYVSWLAPYFNIRLMRLIQGVGISLPLGHKGTAKLIDAKTASALHRRNNDIKGKVMGADEHGRLFSIGHHLPVMWVSSYGAEIYTDKNGGKHKVKSGPSAHQGRHNQFRGLQRMSPCIAFGDCFVKFRANPDKDKDYGQPAVFVALRKDLSRNEKDKGQPWEINGSATVSITHGDQGTGSVTLRSGEGAAISKALVYYHRYECKPNGTRLDCQSNWREHPNLFNPYWRAKLHPLTRVEAGLVLSVGSGLSDYLPALVGPVN